MSGLIQRQNHRGPGLTGQIDGSLVRRREGAAGVHHQRQGVAILQRAADSVHQALVERRIGFMNSGRIDKHDLRAGQG